MSCEKPELTRIDLDRVKRDAKRLCKIRNISLCETQNEIARSFGFQTFESMRAKVMAARVVASPRPISDDPDLEDLLAWFKSRFTPISDYDARVSPIIAKSLRHYERIQGRPALLPVDVGDEIDFGYDYRPFRISRHPKALVAEELLEAEGEWVANTFLDSLRIHKGGFLGNGPDDVVGHRIALEVFDERRNTTPSA